MKIFKDMVTSARNMGIIGGMQEIVEIDKTGILVEPGNVSDLTKGILRLLQDEHLRKSMGIAARKRVKDVFSWEKVVGSLLTEYNKICDARCLIKS